MDKANNGKNRKTAKPGDVSDKKYHVENYGKKISGQLKNVFILGRRSSHFNVSIVPS